MRTVILFVALAIASSVYTQSALKEDSKFTCLQKIADETKTGPWVFIHFTQITPQIQSTDLQLLSCTL